MPDLLTPVTTRALSTPSAEELSNKNINSPDDALQILRSQPNIESLSEVLQWLTNDRSKESSFNIKAPFDSKASQILFSIVTEIIPNYWNLLENKNGPDGIELGALLIRCLRSVLGVGSIANRLQLLLREHSSNGKSAKATVQQVVDLVKVLERILHDDDCISIIWSDLALAVPNEVKRTVAWKEFTSWVAGGKILSLAAEADQAYNESTSSIREVTWLSQGNKFSTWLGRNCAYVVNTPLKDDKNQQKAVAQLFGRALALGYADPLVENALASLLAGDDRKLESYRVFIGFLKPNEGKSVILSLIEILAARLNPVDAEGLDIDEIDRRRRFLAGAAALSSNLVKNNARLRDVLVEWLHGAATATTSQGLSVHRAVIAAIADDHQLMKEIFQRALGQFGDKLNIKHIPISQQEASVQILLIVIGYLYRKEPEYIARESKGSIYINSISNRLSASSQRACFLGMLVGTAVSELVDAKEKRMNFSAEEIDGAEGKWFRSLIEVQDMVGSISDLRSGKSKTKIGVDGYGAKAVVPSSGKSSHKKGTSKVVSIEEIDEESESEDEGLVRYQKPDSDVSDEDEDATLVQRNKPKAPVYVRDLIAGLRDTENFDRHKLALSKASSLIRRKANFGSEISEHIEELAALLTGLGDKYNIDDFQKMRLQGMIALIVAQPLQMGQWFSKSLFHGDYSLGQRASILTALGLGARELAGLQEEDSVITGAATVAKNPFPSAVLPDKLHKIYASEAKPLNAITEKMEKTMIKPMAAEAADQLSGPNALKVRTFSSRMEVEKKRVKPIPNELAKIVANGFFFPLTGLWRAQFQAYGDQNVHTSPLLLTHYLKTLSLILHASGTSTVSLPQMTLEFWDLLLSLRSRASDLPVLEALLFSFLTLLEINTNNQRRLAEEHGKELLETREWVQMVFENTGGGSEEGERVRMLAAGILTKTREFLEKYQRLMLGDLANFM